LLEFQVEGMNRVTTLFRGTSVRVERFDHPEPSVHEDPDSERTELIVVTFVEHGAFDMREDGDWWRFSRHDVLLSTPGRRRCYRHLEAFPQDVCLSISFAPDVVEDALGRPPAGSLPPKVPAGSASTFALRWVLDALDSSCPLTTESAAFHCALALGPHRWEGTTPMSGAGAHTRRIREACATLAIRPEERHSLTSLAEHARMSPFHFARVFSELVGEPPHRYLVRARMRRAAGLLRQGASVTRASVESGFPDVAHFSRMFHRRYGIPPSRYPT
jgi:AraC-like DNA-binding protein